MNTHCKIGHVTLKPEEIIRQRNEWLRIVLGDHEADLIIETSNITGAWYDIASRGKPSD